MPKVLRSDGVLARFLGSYHLAAKRVTSLCRQRAVGQPSPGAGRGYRPWLTSLPLLLALLLGLTSFVPPSTLDASVVGASAVGQGGATLEFAAAFQGVDGLQEPVQATLRLPPGASTRQPLRLLVALHGYGGNGQDFSRPLWQVTDQLGWAVLAPTVAYRDWQDPSQVREDMHYDLPGLRALIEELPVRTGLRLQSRVLLYGFSRGAQYAHRFALAYPDMVESVVAMAAGTYTLPQTSWVEPDGSKLAINIPFGLADIQTHTRQQFDVRALRQVRFFIGVGSDDHRVQDVPRGWDPYIGTCRVKRANAFLAALRWEGVPVEYREFANTGHVETAEIRLAALQFLALSHDTQAWPAAAGHSGPGVPFLRRLVLGFSQRLVEIGQDVLQ
ncbi:MAG: alpha/beta hydrolase [Chloroflexota bacterium]